MLIGAAASEEIEITKYGTGSTTYDVVGNNTITDMISYEDGKFDIDWGAKSFGIDLYYSYRVKKIVLHQDADSEEALTQDKISIYGSQYNQDDLFTEIEDYTIVPDSGDYIIEFSDSFYGRYFKITTHYNEMDSSGDVIYDSTKDYFALDSAAPVDVYYLTGGRNEFYSIDGKGNRNSKTIMSLEIESGAYTYYDGSDLIKTDGVYGYRYDDNGNLISKGSSYTENITTNYFFTGNRHLAKKIGETVYYYGLNNVGSTVLLTDSDGNSVWEGDVTPYGDKLTSSGELDDTVMYTGKMYDDATGMFYYNARWYDPNLGRFITEDPIKDGDNWYMYAANNPLRFVDPTGLYVIVSYFNETTERIEYSISFQNKITNNSRLISNFIPFGIIVPIMQNKLYNLENKVKGNHYYIEYDSDIKYDLTGLAGDILSLTPMGKTNEAVKLFTYYKTSQGLLYSSIDTQKDKDKMNFLGAVAMPVLKDIDNKEDAIRLAEFIVDNIDVYEKKRLDENFTETEWIKIVRSKYFNEDQKNIEIYDSVIEEVYE